MGMDPKSAKFISLHILIAPPVFASNMNESLRQCVQLNFDIFSTTPIIGSLTFLQKLASFRTSCNATSCGVVTRIAPVMPVSFRNWTSDKCSSEVPGGVSNIKYSGAVSGSSPCQSTSFRNCFMSPFFFGPRQIIASSALGSLYKYIYDKDIQKSNGHNREVIIHRDRFPACVGHVNRFVLGCSHAWNRRATNINVN